MSQDRVRELTELGMSLLAEGKYAEALDAASEATALAPTDSEPHIQRGIALSSLQRGAEADDAFKRALVLSPYSAKAHFNFAVHRFHQGEFQAARELAEEALQLDPNHASARDLANQLRGEAEVPAPAPEATYAEIPAMAPPPSDPVPTVQGSAAPQAHVVDFIGKLGAGWRVAGWLLSVLNFSACAGYFRLAAKYQPETMADFDSKVSMMAKDPLTQVVMLSLLASWFLIVLYSVLDIVDRKQSWLWLIPIAGCSCFLGWMLVPVYLLANRTPPSRR